MLRIEFVSHHRDGRPGGKSLSIFCLACVVLVCPGFIALVQVYSPSVGPLHFSLRRSGNARRSPQIRGVLWLALLSLCEARNIRVFITAVSSLYFRS